MKDSEKTKDQLIDELVVLRQRVVELEISEAQCQQAESALRESEQRFRLLVESAQDYAGSDTEVVVKLKSFLVLHCSHE